MKRRQRRGDGAVIDARRRRGRRGDGVTKDDGGREAR